MDRLFGRSCPVKTRCQWSCDERRIHEADAVIFHAFDIIYNRMSMPNRLLSKPNAVWILWSDEPPSIIDYSHFVSYRFNWTISYKLDSEVSIGAYGLFSNRIDPLSDEDHERWIDKEFSRRDRGALWFVSNCHSKHRLQIYADLKHSSHVNIEGYGRCVDYYPLHWCQSFSPCEHDYVSTFKFYLSFESNTCAHYVTEKFYKAYYYNLIPIVYGPKKDFYDDLAPKQSFIHVEQFENDMNRLANHLEEINRNRTLFAMYHRWRKVQRVIVDVQVLEPIRMCELCYRLTRIRRGEMIYYEDIQAFFNEQCSST
jgi:glycoprotein 3-alpha-L-fucosyltransferase